MVCGAFHWWQPELSHFHASITANADPELAVAAAEVTLLYPFWAAQLQLLILASTACPPAL